LLKTPASGADLLSMRFLGVSSLLVTLCVATYLGAAQLRNVTGEVGPQGGGARGDAEIAGATFVARRADALLDVHRAQAGTYVGGSVDEVEGVELVRADATSYCLKIHGHGGDLYELGPGGDVSTTPC
jgi:hypothetical protein